MDAHGAGEPRKISHPGGKNGWYRVDCVRDGCDYEATEALAHHATKRVETHARDKARLICPHCAGRLVDKGHGPNGALTCRDCLADVVR